MKEVGQTIGSYHLVEKLGAGGMAEVYKAYQPRLERYVALKFIRPELAEAAGFLPRFEQEAKLLARLNHPRIVHIYDFGEEAGRCYLVMEYVAGGILKEWLRSLRAAGQTLTSEQVLVILQQVCAALDYAHQQNIIHRDIKPANIMLTADHRVLLSDFGLARLAGQPGELSQTGGTSGTPAYMSPEQVRGDQGKIGPASDLYAWGMVLYEMLTGQLPFIADTPLALMLKHVQEAPRLPRTLNPALPESVERVLLKTLAKEPGDRYQRAEELAQAFMAVVEPAASFSPDTTPTMPRLDWWPQAQTDSAPAPGQPPFKGLQYFDETDAGLFFGREVLTARLVGRLTPSPALPLRGGGRESQAPSPAPGEGWGGLSRVGFFTNQGLTKSDKLQI
jgi:serine/threonine-protein kinase